MAVRFTLLWKKLDDPLALALVRMKCRRYLASSKAMSDLLRVRNGLTLRRGAIAKQQSPLPADVCVAEPPATLRRSGWLTLEFDRGKLRYPCVRTGGVENTVNIEHVIRSPKAKVVIEENVLARASGKSLQTTPLQRATASAFTFSGARTTTRQIGSHR